MYVSKIYTIWKFGLIFCDAEGYEKQRWEYLGDSIYQGPTNELPDDVAEMVAELHPNVLQYYQLNMVPLFRGYEGPLKTRGTESPQMAIFSKMNRSEKHNCDHVIIWPIIDTHLKHPLP